MIWRFGPFELDEDRRELRLGGREVMVEPLVFDLLADLIRHRDRVVSKDELFDRVWAGAIVTEGSLQRAVSLARSALRSGELADAIKTFSRRGYRFTAGVTETDTTPVGAQADVSATPLLAARKEFERNNWRGALNAFVAADESEGLTGPDLERTAWCHLNLGRPGDSISWLERAATAHSIAADSTGVARAAVLLCQVHLEARQLTIASGWQQRAEKLLANHSPCREVAQFEWITGRLALAGGDIETALRHAERALELARAIEDFDLEAVSLIYLGHVCIVRGDVRRGLALHEEAGAAVLGGPVAPWFAGLVYCGLVYICQNRGDWSRAAHWTEAFGRWSQRATTATYPAVCRMHRAEVLALKGELETAEREITEVRSELEVSAPWAVGDAERLHGEVLRARGDLTGAEEAYRRAQVVGWDSCPGWAELLIERKDTTAAIRALERALENPSWPCRQRRRLLAAALTRAAALSGDTTRAQQALDIAMSIENGDVTPAQQGALERARAEIAASEGRVEDAVQLLRSALRIWREIDAILEVAPIHERLAELLLSAGDSSGAVMELKAAENLWREAGSVSRANACASRYQDLPTT